MATYNSYLKRGSKGIQVSDLQTALNSYGYNLAVDGSFGPATEAAVRDYQGKNGLTVDGTVGANTYNSIFGTKSTASQPIAPPSYGSYTPGAAAVSAGNDLEAHKATKPGEYAASDSVAQAQARVDSILAQKPGAYSMSADTLAAKDAYDAHAANKPGEYQYSYADQLNAMMDKILNREEFSYDVNSDALYQQYKDQYIREGRAAMRDTIGQASAMTGGYGNSYAASAGNQAYNAYLGKLNDIVPELYQRAYDRYNQEGQDLLNRYGMLADRESTEYGQYRDRMSDYYTDYGLLADAYNTEYSRDYGMYRDAVSDHYNDLGYATDVYNTESERDYGRYRDGVNDYNNMLSYLSDIYNNERAFDYGVQADDRAAEQWQATFDQNAEQNAAESKNAEYSKLEARIMNTGYAPSKEELEATGMSPEYAEQLKAAYEEAKSREDAAYVLDTQGAAYDKLIGWINVGYEPNDGELAAAGISRAQYEAYRSYLDEETVEAAAALGPNDINKWAELIASAQSVTELEYYVSMFAQYDAELANIYAEEWYTAHPDLQDGRVPKQENVVTDPDDIADIKNAILDSATLSEAIEVAVRTKERDGGLTTNSLAQWIEDNDLLGVATQAEAEKNAELIAQVDEDLAMAYFDQWIEMHSPKDKQDTPPREGPAGGRTNITTNTAEMW